MLNNHVDSELVQAAVMQWSLLCGIVYPFWKRISERRLLKRGADFVSIQIKFPPSMQ